MNISPSVNENRQRVLQVAKEIITRKGFSAVGLNEILTAAGIPKGSFYYYFSSKEEFGSAMLEDYFCGYMAEMDRLITTGTCAADTLMRYWQGCWRQTTSRFRKAINAWPSSWVPRSVTYLTGCVRY